MSQAIDPMALARFMVMDGASRLVLAFSGIPEGPLRESVIHMAETMSATYAGAPASQQAPDPLGVLNIAVTPPPAPVAKALPPPPATPSGPKIKTGDPSLRAVQLRLEGKYPHEIVTETGLRLGAVYTAIGEARRAGVKFPNIGRAKQGLTKKDAVTYVTDISEVTDHHMNGAINKAAESRGITPEAYIGRRKLALEMALDRRNLMEIIAATGENKATLSTWMNTARAAGYSVPYMASYTYAAAVEPKGEVVRLKPRPKLKPTSAPRSFAYRLEDYTNGGRQIQVSIEKGAKQVGVTVEKYLSLRAEALKLFAQNVSVPEVAKRLGLTKTQSSNWRERALSAGVITLDRAQA